MVDKEDTTTLRTKNRGRTGFGCAVKVVAALFSLGAARLEAGEPDLAAPPKPADKAPIGERLALLARRDVYGEKVEAQGPVFRSAAVIANRMAIEFDHAEGLKTADGAAPTVFQLAGSDQNWHPATAVIKGNTVEVEAEGLATPAFVRYALAGKPTVNLVNGSGLSAYSFRTDGWDK